MTLPFENDTSRIVKRLAKQNMKANRRTSISIMVAILETKAADEKTSGYGRAAL